MRVRLTNEVREYLTNVSKDFPLEQVWELFNMQYPYMTKHKDINYLENLLNENEIEYFREGDLGIFTLREAVAIYNLTKICKSIEEIYSSYNQQFPNKCDFEKFNNESNKLKSIKEFKEKYNIDYKFNMFEISFVSDSIKNKDTVEETYNKFIDRFQSSISYDNFISHYQTIKNHREESVGKKPFEFTDSDIELLKKLANGNRSKSQLYQEFSNISKTKIGINTFNKRITELNLDIKDGRKGAKAIEFTDSDIDLIVSLANGTISIASALEKYNKSASIQVSYPTFLRKVKSLGLQAKFASNVHKSTSRKGDTKKKQPKQSMGRTIYTDEFIKDLTELYTVHPLSKCVDIMDTWGKYDDILQGDNVLTKLNKLISRKGIKKDAKINMEKRQVADETGIVGIIQELSKDYTCGEVYDILVKDYGYKETGHKPFATKWNRITQFKVYDEVTDSDMIVIEEIVNSGYVGRAAAAEVHVRFPHRYTNAVIYRAISKAKSKSKSVHIHEITSPDKIIKINEQGLTVEEPEEIVAWHQNEQVDKFQPIIDEVNSIFENRCKKLNVSTKSEDSTNKLIEAIKVLLEYSEDTKEIIKTCTDQEDIIEQYRREIDHEIENLPFSDVDTTAQNKIKVLRMKRREIKNTKENSDLINPIANIIQHNASKFRQVLSALEKKKEERDNFIFIPLVDTTMVNKYEWCKAGWAGSARANAPILTTHKKEMREEAKKKNSNIKKFRVQAEYMAWDGKPFHTMYYDIYAVSTEKAIENSKNFFDDLSRKHNNSRYTIKDAYQLNT